MERVRFQVDLIHYTKDGYYFAEGELFGTQQMIHKAPQVGDFIDITMVHVQSKSMIIFNNQHSKAPIKNQKEFILKFVNNDVDAIVYDRIVYEEYIEIRAIQAIYSEDSTIFLSHYLKDNNKVWRLTSDYIRAIELMG